jgi:hypothetical protein
MYPSSSWGLGAIRGLVFCGPTAMAKFFLGLIAIAFTVLIAALVYAAFHL